MNTVVRKLHSSVEYIRYIVVIFLRIFIELILFCYVDKSHVISDLFVISNRDNSSFIDKISTLAIYINAADLLTGPSVLIKCYCQEALATNTFRNAFDKNITQP